ncbi:phosphonate ABC transporter, permease protein PhnE [Desulfocapsa sulfexigens DSM 10523]|uniref:Phosphonate ABC transporter, permease protein PhnE n=1 Tax=Desulfocapsa sulfexigens (strain DSM 10523 / SB164P1) TaxID=1167006 RepID=M1NEF9_DESSD|nr:phosphonate ABC transporter, permease protein PhnE [Desulfocapsa sulfexigens]AGF78089.1 phosphonate ABC transporter, permease protein PhnE [Desulfocapsa sulfexigens DSM 10523]
MTSLQITPEYLQKKSSPFQWQNLLILVLISAVYSTSWLNTEMSVGSLIDGWSHMQSYIVGNPDIEGSSFFPPSFIVYDIRLYLKAMLETIEMAVVALFISIAVGFPLSLLASRNILKILIPGRGILARGLRRILYTIAMLVANVFRSINEIVWALLFVSAVGLGPMAGILALGVHTAGVLCKLLAEGNEAIDPGPVEALTATGASFPKIIVYAVLPQTMPHFISMVLYRFESDVRSASILGFVGAGGIGFYLFDKVRAFENADVTTIIIIIVLTVWLIDKLSAGIRAKFI